MVVQVVVFHSAYGLRQAEADAATRLRAAGHDVTTPDLYDGQTAGTLDAALALMDTVGWEVICARARQALEAVPQTAVLAGLSMGAGVIGSMWDQRRTTAGVVLLHGIAPIPASARPGLPVQVHLAEDDPFAPRQAVAQWQADAARAGLAAQVFTYPGAGHFYTDPGLADYHSAAADRTWRRVTAFLSGLLLPGGAERGGQALGMPGGDRPAPAVNRHHGTFWILVACMGALGLALRGAFIGCRRCRRPAWTR